MNRPIIMETGKMNIHLTNVGLLDWWCYSDGEISINWKNEGQPIVWNHGIYLTGLIGDNIVGSAADYGITYSPGPVIDGQAAMQVTPEDSLLYRVYGICNDTPADNQDYQQWPIQWGAPHNSDGSPKVLGDITYYTVYNDVDTRTEYRDYLFAPSPFEIRETVWGYLSIDTWLGNILFLKYQIYNRGQDDLNEVTFGMRTDIDIGDCVCQNWGGYNSDADYMYVYYYGIEGTDCISPNACAYTILQGPCVNSPDSTGFEFGKWKKDKRNLPTSFGWYIFNESSRQDSQYLATPPANLEEFRNVALGLKRDGNPIINPITGDTTTFTYDGDPISGEGWLWDIPTYQGGVGFIIGCSPFDLPAGDSTEVVLALVVGEGFTGLEAVAHLNELMPQTRDAWNKQLPANNIDDNLTKTADFKLYQNYPNPFNPITIIEYEIPKKADINLSIYDIQGRIVENLVNQKQPVGAYSVKWNASNYSSGVYFYKIWSRDFQQTKKMLLIK